VEYQLNPDRANFKATAPAIMTEEDSMSKMAQVRQLEDVNDGPLSSANDPDEGKSIWKIMRENPRVIIYAALANTGSLLFGYDILVTGACVALPAFS
jgi:hypothetical protein